ncbi:MAG: SAM-dependent methyltransferase [Candidatus Thorarchaeota archaeon]
MADIHKKDPHYQRAKRDKYRARSAYKLLDIQKRFNIFKRAFYILDLGCAPGSWLQVAKEFAEDNLTKYNDQYYHRDHYLILGVDVKKVSPIENVQIIKMDFMKPKVITYLETCFQTDVDLILSDASINKTGNKFSDHLRQNNLCRRVLEITVALLRLNGSLIMKTFQGPDSNEVFHKAKSVFKMVKAFKPQSSKKKSNEIYLIGLQKR